MAELRTSEVEDLLAVLAGLHEPDDIFALLEDLFTVREIKDISQRFQVACMLREGKSYAAIEQTTGASATTIARVSKALNYGSGGYAQAFAVLDQTGADHGIPEGYEMVCDGDCCRLVACGEEAPGVRTSDSRDDQPSSHISGLVEA